MELAGNFTTIPAAKARDNLGVTAELAKKLDRDGTSRMTGLLGLKDTAGVIANSAGGLGSLEVRSLSNADAAFVTFHRPGAFAAYFGLDTDNKFKVGGWSFGGNSYEVLTAQGGWTVNGATTFKGGLLRYDHTGGPTDTASANFARVASYSGGTPGYTNSAARVYTRVGADAKAFEWNLVAELDNSAMGGGENCSAYFQALKRGDGATFGHVVETREEPGAPYGALVSQEIDLTANGDDPQNLRIGIDVVCARRSSASAYGELGYGLKVGTRTENGNPEVARVKRAVHVSANWAVAAYGAHHLATLQAALNSNFVYMDFKAPVNGNEVQFIMRERRTQAGNGWTTTATEFVRVVDGSAVSSIAFGNGSTTLTQGEHRVTVNSNGTIGLPVQAADPSTRSPGQMYFNSAVNKMRYFDSNGTMRQIATEN